MLIRFEYLALFVPASWDHNLDLRIAAVLGILPLAFGLKIHRKFQRQFKFCVPFSGCSRSLKLVV